MSSLEKSRAAHRCNQAVSRVLATGARTYDPWVPYRLEESMRRHQVPGLSLAVFDRGKIVWAKGFGLREAGQPQRVRPDTLFQAGSISKPVAAVGVLRLVEEGKLELDADISVYLRRWKVPVVRAGKGPLSRSIRPRLSVRKLLSHSAGLTVHGFWGYHRSGPFPTLEQMLGGNGPASNARIEVNLIPGTQTRYSGGGYLVLQLLIEEVTGMPFAQVLKEKVLGPAGMDDSGYEQPLPRRLWHRAASGHDGMPGPKKIPGSWRVHPELAAAGLWTTAPDLARFMMAIQRSLAGAPRGILSKAMTETMLSPQISDDMGLGFSLRDPGGEPYFEHGGMNSGFVSWAHAFRKGGCGAVVMTNSLTGWAVGEECLRSLSRACGWRSYLPPVKPVYKNRSSDLEAFEGTYRLASGIEVQVTRRYTALSIQWGDQDPMPVLARSRTKFFSLHSNSEFEFILEKGRCRGMTLHQEGQQTRAERAKERVRSK